MIDDTIVWMMNIFSMILGRRELRRGVSGVKCDGKADLDVRFVVAPQNLTKNCKTLIFRPKDFAHISFSASNHEMRGNA